MLILLFGIICLVFFSLSSLFGQCWQHSVAFWAAMLAAEVRDNVDRKQLLQ